MEKDNFERLARALCHRRPFRPYTVEFVSGETIEVDHPEALIIRAGVAVYLSADGTPAWFDHAGVSRVNGEVDQSTPTAAKA